MWQFDLPVKSESPASPAEKKKNVKSTRRSGAGCIHLLQAQREAETLTGR